MQRTIWGYFQTIIQSDDLQETLFFIVKIAYFCLNYDDKNALKRDCFLGQCFKIARGLEQRGGNGKRDTFSTSKNGKKAGKKSVFGSSSLYIIVWKQAQILLCMTIKSRHAKNNLGLFPDNYIERRSLGNARFIGR